jgi:hypothetical protein
MELWSPAEDTRHSNCTLYDIPANCRIVTVRRDWASQLMSDMGMRKTTRCCPSSFRTRAKSYRDMVIPMSSSRAATTHTVNLLDQAATFSNYFVRNEKQGCNLEWRSGEPFQRIFFGFFLLPNYNNEESKFLHTLVCLCGIFGPPAHETRTCTTVLPAIS